MIGLLFGKLVVKQELKNYKNTGKSYYVCECKCKKECIIRKDRLVRKRSVQCIDCSKPKLKIIPGVTYGKWIVLGEAGKNDRGEHLAKVKCECGLKKISVFRHIKGQRSRQCKHCSSKRPIKEVKSEDVFFKRTVIEILGRSLKGNIYVKTRCECGHIDSVMFYDLKKGNSSQCINCANNKKSKQQQGQVPVHVIKHGLSYHPLYKLWSNIKDRCYSKNDRNYIHYGARGIEIDYSWKHDVKKFIQDVLSEIGPRVPGMHLDRINTNDDYRPGNIRWVSPAENVLNRRISLKNRDENIVVPIKSLQKLLKLSIEHIPVSELKILVKDKGVKSIFLLSQLDNKILQYLGIRFSTRSD